MKIAIMQPYFFPYIGYFQLLHAADIFVVYDNIEYTKKGWINRNRYLLNEKDAYFTIPIQKDSDFLMVKERRIARDFNKNKLLNTIREAYRKAPNFPQAFHIFEESVLQHETNLFQYIHHSICKVAAELNIQTQIIVSSSIQINHSLKSQDKVLAICKALNASTYLNPIGGLELYSKETFKNHEIQLNFIRSNPLEYKQFANQFVPWLSIIDVMMFNRLDRVKEMLEEYQVMQ